MRRRQEGWVGLPDRVRNAVVKIERRAEQLPSPLRQLGLGATALATRTLGSITGIETTDPLVALTFDDGPDPEVTPAVLDILAERGVSATFFMLSERAEQHSDLARRVAAEGHEVALHGANHDNLTRLHTRQIIDRVHGGRERLAAVVGVPIRLFRPPYGAQSITSYLLTRSWGLGVVMWSVDPHDWDETESAEIVERAVGRSGAGDIILLHDGWTSTSGDPSSTAPQGKPQVVESIVDGLTGSGLGVRSVGELLQVGPGRKRVWFDSG